MKATDIFLLMLYAAGGTIKGKTLIHKRGFFLKKLTALDLKYKPHFYGPFSPELEAAIGTCKALGLVEQRTMSYGMANSRGFEIRRFDYTITPDGEKVVANLRRRMPQESDKIIRCLQKIASYDSDDYVKLSLAAKAMYVLEEKKQPMGYEDIVKEAKNYDWNISNTDIKEAADFLKHLGLVQETNIS